MHKGFWVGLVLLMGSGIVSAAPIVDNFNAMINIGSPGVTGGGSGYNGGYWYEYPNTGWWNQWFYDHPLDLTRWKVIDVSMTITPTGLPNSWLEVAVNWSTDLYPSNPGQPPLPPLDPLTESLWIGRQVIYSGSFDIGPQDPIQFELQVPIVIPDYNPEWVSIDVQGSGVAILGTITHECIPEPATAGFVILAGLAMLRRR